MALALGDVVIGLAAVLAETRHMSHLAITP